MGPVTFHRQKECGPFANEKTTNRRNIVGSFGRMFVWSENSKIFFGARFEKG